MRVLVLGSGVIGVASAYYLAQQGATVTVLDRQAGPAQETSFGNAGQISRAGPAAEPQAAPTTTTPAAAQPAEPSAQEVANKLLGHVKSLGLPITGLSISYNSASDLATVRGQVQSQADREKIVLAVGNIDHVAKVDDQLTVSSPEPESKFYTVKSGDSLSKISKEFYGDANQYNKIFEANRPLLKDADDIFPGQVLRIPA